MRGRKGQGEMGEERKARGQGKGMGGGTHTGLFGLCHNGKCFNQQL